MGRNILDGQFARPQGVLFMFQSQWSRFFIVDKPYKNMPNVGYRSVSRERRRLRDRLSDDRNAQNLFKGLLGE